MVAARTHKTPRPGRKLLPVCRGASVAGRRGVDGAHDRWRCGAGAGLPEPRHQDHRRSEPRRFFPHRRRTSQRRMGTAGGGRAATGRRRQACRQRCAGRAGGRLHHAVRDADLHAQHRDESRDLRSDEGVRAGRACRAHFLCAGHQSERAGEVGRGIGGLCEAKSRQAQLRLGRHRHRAASGLRISQQGRRHRHHPCPLPRCEFRHDGDRRQRHANVFRRCDQCQAADQCPARCAGWRSARRGVRYCCRICRP